MGSERDGGPWAEPRSLGEVTISRRKDFFFRLSTKKAEWFSSRGAQRLQDPGWGRREERGSYRGALELCIPDPPLHSSHQI